MPGEAFDALVAHELKDPEGRREYAAEITRIAEQQEDVVAESNIRRSTEDSTLSTQAAEVREPTSVHRTGPRIPIYMDFKTGKVYTPVDPKAIPLVGMPKLREYDPSLDSPQVRAADELAELNEEMGLYGDVPANEENS